MKKLFYFLLVCFAFSAFGESLVWSNALNDASRWQPARKRYLDPDLPVTEKCSGYMTYKALLNKSTVCFMAEKCLGQQENLWTAPAFGLQSVESLGGARSFRFELMTELPIPEKITRAELILTGKGQKKLCYPFEPPTSGKFEEIIIPLDPQCDYSVFDTISIRLETPAPKFVWYLRNARIDGTAIGTSQVSPIDTALAVRAAVPGTMFYESESLRFNCVIPETTKFAVTDIYGKKKIEGTLNPGWNTLPKLPCGYYFLSLVSSRNRYVNQRSFAVVNDNRPLPQGKESGYAMVVAFTDAGQAFYGGVRNDVFPGPIHDVLINLISRCGLSNVRDGSNWKRTQDFTPMCLTNAKDLAATGIIPTHVSVPCGGPLDDIEAVYAHAQNTGSAFRGLIRYMEFINEPEAFTQLNPWNFAAISKAAFLGFKKANPELPVLSSSFLQMPYADVALKSKLADYFDVFNMHCYYHISLYPGIVARLKKMLRAHGIENRAVHITECSSFDEGEATENSYASGIKVQSHAQELSRTEFTIKSQVIMQSLGISATYSFIMPPYNEHGGLKDWGLMRRDLSVKPALAAFATLTGTLAGAEYQGTYETVPGVRGFLYLQPDGLQTLAVWRQSEVDVSGLSEDTVARITEVIISQAAGTYQYKDAFGTPKTLQAHNGKLVIPISRLIGYVNGLIGLKPTIPAPGKKVAKADHGNYDHTVVIDIQNGTDFPETKNRCFVTPVKETGKLSIRLYNFSAEEKRGTLAFQGGRIHNMPETVALPPMGKVCLELEMTPEFREGEYIADFTVDGVFNGRKVTPAVMPVCKIDRLKTIATVLPGAGAASSWRGNASAPMVIKDAPEEKAVSFSCKLKNTMDNFIYPEYILQKGESFADAVGFQFEIKIDEQSMEMWKKWPFATVFFVFDTTPERGDAVQIDYDPTPQKLGSWKTVRIFFAGVLSNPEDIRMVRIGLNSKNTSSPVEFQVRNLQVLKKR